MINRRKRGVVEVLTDPSKNILSFLIVGVFLVTVASDALSSLVLDSLGPWLKDNYGINPALFRIILWLGITILILIPVYSLDLTNWLTQRITPQTLKPKPLSATYPGLIVIMSRTGGGLLKTAAAEAIQHHWNEGNGNLRHCWILCGGESVTEQARQMIKQVVGGRVKQEEEFDLILTSPANIDRELFVSLRQIPGSEINDPIATFNLIKSIYIKAENQDLEPEEIIADYTGGNKSMTAGMILASADVDRTLQFMKPTKYTDDGRVDPNFPSEATKIEIGFKVTPIRRKKR